MSNDPEHKDILGNYIRIGDSAVVPDGRRNLRVGVVERVTPKMVAVKTVGSGISRRERLLYPGDILVVNDSKVTLYLLKHQAQ